MTEVGVESRKEWPTTATSPREDRRNRERGWLLEVSNFLTQFQSHLLPNVDVGIISPNDLEQVLQFRKDLTIFQNGCEWKRVLKAYSRQDADSDFGSITAKLVSVQEDLQASLQENISKTTDRTKSIHLLLQRLEVWATKLVAQDFLVARRTLFDPSSSSSSAKRAASSRGSCCHSCLLNLPCSKYFASIIPPVKMTKEEKRQRLSASTTDSQNVGPSINCCSMSLPPNKYTFQVYARFAMIVSMYLEGNISEELLATCSVEQQQEKLLRKLLTSPACEHNLNKSRKHANGKNPIYTDDYDWKSEDILALWMRAQRNTRSMRHFRMLFEVHRLPQETRESGNVATPMRAIFRGNPNLVEIRVQDTSDLVDQLVEWAVVNQSMYTFPHVRQQIMKDILKQSTSTFRKRQREDNGTQQLHQEPIQVSGKRIRWDDTADVTHTAETRKEQVEMLREACRRYVLRWFARRNRRILTPLLSDGMYDCPGLDIGERVTSNIWKDFPKHQINELFFMLRQQLEETLSKNVQNEGSWIEDNTLEKVDLGLDEAARYHFGGPRYDSQQRFLPNGNFRHQVLSLCDALSTAWPNQLELVEETKKDFIEMYDHFFPPEKPLGGENEGEVVQLATSLMDPGSGVATHLTEMINSIPAPWSHICVECRKEKKDPLKTCANCEQIFHDGCATAGKEVDLGDILQKSSLFKGLIKLKKPAASVRKPDFSIEFSPATHWEEKEIVVRRHVLENGNVPRLLLQIHNTEDCNEAFQSLDASSATIFNLRRLTKKRVRKNMEIALAAKFPRNGCLIVGAEHLGAGYQSGLRVGDIITRVQCVTYANPKDQNQHGSRMCDLSSISTHDRKKIISVSATEMILTVLRPSEDVLKIMIDWIVAIRQENQKMLLNVLTDNDDKLWVCDSCCRPSSELSRTPESSRREAEFCRAVVRRVGMESYARPFIGDGPSGETSIWSLRRLDAMMTRIMQESSGDVFFPPSNAFPEPPKFDVTRDPLPSAGEEHQDRPAALLSAALEAFLSSSVSDIKDGEIQLCGFLFHFVRAFSLWVVVSSTEIDGFVTAGPPVYFRCSRPPWIRPTCSVCFSRGCDEHSSICNNQQCIRSNSPSTPPAIDGVREEDCKKAREAIAKYSQYASLVGTTFWVLPDDPLVQNVIQVVPIDHANRPVEFVVASYLPSNFVDAVTAARKFDKFDRIVEGEGIYHLLPVVSSNQQRYLLDRCKLRDCSQEKGMGQLWTGLEVLNLEGVARYSPLAVREKVRASAVIFTMVHLAMATDLLKNASVSPGHMMEMLGGKTTNEGLKISSSLLEHLLRGSYASEVIRSLIPSDIEEQEDQDGEQYEGYPVKEFPGRCPLNPILSTDLQVYPLKYLGNKKCRLFYSDILYHGERERVILDELMEPSELFPCAGAVKSAPTEYIFTPPAPRGWGFEIVQWQDEKNLCRVGRILRNSSASKAGIKTNDIIIAVNGLSLGLFTSHSEFLSSVRGMPNIKVAMEGVLNDGQIASVMSTLHKLDQKYASEVKLTVIRSKMSDVGGPSFSSGRDQLFDPTAGVTTRTSLPGRNLGQLGPSSHMTSAPVEIIDLTNDNTNTRAENTTCMQEQQSHISDMPVDTGESNLNGSVFGLNNNVHRHAQTQRPVDDTRRSTFNGMDNFAIATNHSTHNTTVGGLQTLLLQTKSIRPLLGRNDFHRPAGHGTVLTALEIAVFFHAVVSDCPNYGIRLLMPRYDLRTLLQQIQCVTTFWTSREVCSIPAIDGRCYKMIVDLDGKRMICKDFPEIGNPILKETVRGVMYEYKSPNKPLPIDRIIEKWYEERHKEQQILDKAKQIIRHHQQESIPRADVNVLTHVSQNSSFQFGQQRPYTIQAQQHIDHGSTPTHQAWNDRRYVALNSQDTHSTTDQRWRPQNHQRCGFDGGDPRSNLAQSVSGTNGSQRRIFHHKSVANYVQQPLIHAQTRQQAEWNKDATASGQEENVTVEEFGSSVRAFQQSDSGSIVPERIRGGGDGAKAGEDDASCNIEEVDEVQNDLPCLANIPSTEWDGKPIFAVVDTYARDGSISEAMLVGFVKFEQSSSENEPSTPETVEVEAYYLSNVGYFENCRTLTFDIDELFLIGEDDTTEERKVLAKLQSQNIDPGLRRAQITLADHRRSRSVYEHEKNSLSRLPSHDEELPPSQLKEQRTHVDRECDQNPETSGSQLNGVLIDGYQRDVDIEILEGPKSPSGEREGPAGDNASNDSQQEIANDVTELTKTRELQRRDCVSCRGVDNREDGIDLSIPKESMDTPRKQAATKLVKQLRQLKVLATLPDGRNVVWLSNDHHAVYIQDNVQRHVVEKSNRDFVQCLKDTQFRKDDSISLLQASTSGYSCVWGCSVVLSNRRQSLSFPSIKDLYNHNLKVHSFGKDSEKYSLGQLGSFRRVPDGQSIVELAQQLSSAIVTRFPLLVEEAIISGSASHPASSRQFSTSPTGSILNFPVNGRVLTLFRDIGCSSKRQGINTEQLLDAWTQLSCLYECDATGRFRLTDDEFRRATSQSFVGSPSNEGLETNGKTQASTYKEPHLENDSKYSGYSDCPLCYLPFESYIVVNTEENVENRNNHDGIPLKRGIGCSPISHASGIGKRVNRRKCEEYNGYIPSHLTDAKMTLLHVATVIPESVRFTHKNTDSSPFIDPLNGFRVFDSKENYSLWKSFVYQISDTKMLAQALVSLLASIDRSKLPSWWAGETIGWSTSQFLMTESNSSALFLHIYVLDAALTDLRASSLRRPSSTAQMNEKHHISKETSNQQQLMEKYWSIATWHGLSSFTGTHDTTCYICDSSTTELLQCNLCHNAQHRKCSVISKMDSSKLVHFLCDSCLQVVVRETMDDSTVPLVADGGPAEAAGEN
ncbi:serine endoprotease [Nitzschia inconspicua]|uniref:Serine endoprotease n=1 Tax=Nitzschia inconspicua TaxID=303405 RepID=A0A9K3KM40_9STRA|nr:serine endoprotease [Nitzschia inconspicua]